MYSTSTVTVFHFATRITPVEKIIFELVMTALLGGLTMLLYGRGTRFLEPSARLRDRWTEVSQDERVPRPLPVSV